jgi:flagellin-specific chaperone FliS
VQANLKKDKSIVEEVLRRVVVLRDAWAQMLNSQTITVVEEEKRSVLAAA